MPFHTVKTAATGDSRDEVRRRKGHIVFRHVVSVVMTTMRHGTSDVLTTNTVVVSRRATRTSGAVRQEFFFNRTRITWLTYGLYTVHVTEIPDDTSTPVHDGAAALQVPARHTIAIPYGLTWHARPSSGTLCAYGFTTRGIRTRCDKMCLKIRRLSSGGDGVKTHFTRRPLTAVTRRLIARVRSAIRSRGAGRGWTGGGEVPACVVFVPDFKTDKPDCL